MTRSALLSVFAALLIISANPDLSADRSGSSSDRLITRVFTRYVNADDASKPSRSAIVWEAFRLGRLREVNHKLTDQAAADIRTNPDFSQRLFAVSFLDSRLDSAN